MDGVVKFYALVLKIALGLALAGTLKEATLAMAHRAAHAQQNEMISYSKFTHMLIGPSPKRVPPYSAPRLRKSAKSTQEN